MCLYWINATCKCNYFIWFLPFPKRFLILHFFCVHDWCIVVVVNVFFPCHSIYVWCIYTKITSFTTKSNIDFVLNKSYCWIFVLIVIEEIFSWTNWNKYDSDDLQLGKMQENLFSVKKHKKSLENATIIILLDSQKGYVVIASNLLHD